MAPLGKEREDEETPEDKDRPYHFYQQKMLARQLHYYLSGPIEEPSKYTEMIHQIRSATPNDIINIHLNTPGGQVATGVQLISAIRASQGHIVTHLEGEACSMGALLFLTADEMVVYDDSILMFHNYSGGAYGKGHEIISTIDATNRWYTKLIRTVCTPFLTEEELDKLFNGADLWMLSDEVEDRLKKMAKKLAADAKQDAQDIKVTKPKKRQSKKS